MDITFSTSFYVLKSKFDMSIYLSWCENFLSIMNNCNIVLYTDDKSLEYLNNNIQINSYLKKSNIKVIIYPITEFITYNYKSEWDTNHLENLNLHNLVECSVNMLWNEKINMVKKTKDNNYFNTPFYGWCDIGYFRNRSNDIHTSKLTSWPNKNIFNKLDKNKIYYALINNNNSYLNYLYSIIKQKNEIGLPIQQIPPNQVSIAGGFFVGYREKIDWWHTTYYNKLKLYLENKYLVKDDQIIIIDCIFSELTDGCLNDFCLVNETLPNYDNWFLFQRVFE
jgi:hypothetical protein